MKEIDHSGKYRVFPLVLQPLTPEQCRPPRTVSMPSSQRRWLWPDALSVKGVPRSHTHPPPVPGCEKPPLLSLLGPGQPGTSPWVHPQGGSGLLAPTGSALSVSHTDSCSFALHARSGEVTRFTTPGFPDSPYPARARCQWTLRGDADSVLSLTFRSFDVAPCDDRGSDLVMVYDTLSPVEPRAVVQ